MRYTPVAVPVACDTAHPALPSSQRNVVDKWLAHIYTRCAAAAVSEVPAMNNNDA